MITEEEAENHKQKNVITRALGAEKSVEPDFYRLDVSPETTYSCCVPTAFTVRFAPEKIAEILAGDTAI